MNKLMKTPVRKKYNKETSAGYHRNERQKIIQRNNPDYPSFIKERVIC